MKLICLIIIAANSLLAQPESIYSNKTKLKNSVRFDYQYLSTLIEESGKRNYEEHRDYKNTFIQNSSKFSFFGTFFTQLSLEGFIQNFSPTRFTRTYGYQDYEKISDYDGSCCYTVTADPTSLEISRGSFNEFGGTLGYTTDLGQGLNFYVGYTRVDREQKVQKLYAADFVGNQNSFDFRAIGSSNKSKYGLGINLDFIESARQKDYRSIEAADVKRQDEKDIEDKRVTWGLTTRSVVYFYHHYQATKNFVFKTQYEINSYGDYDYKISRKNSSNSLVENEQAGFNTSVLKFNLEYITKKNHSFFLQAFREGANNSLSLTPAEFNGVDEDISYLSTSISVGMRLLL